MSSPIDDRGDAAGSVILLGMIRWSRSISAIGTSMATSASPSTMSWRRVLGEHDGDAPAPRRAPRRAGSGAEIGSRQERQRPRSISQPSTGTLS